MGKIKRALARKPTPPPLEAPQADPPSSSTRKRPREQDANPLKPTTPTKGSTQAAQAPIDASSDERPAKKSKGEQEMKSDNRDEGEQGIPQDESVKSTGDSSDTLAESVTNGEATPGGEMEMKDSEDSNPLDSLSAEERRKLKGKGKASEDENEERSGGESDELARMKRELAFKNSLIASQSSLLSNFRTAVACTVCLETLDKPYALACGHVFCRKCLLEWFFRPDPTAEDANQAHASSPSQSGSDSESDSNSNSNSSSNSTGSSYVGGSLQGQDFRIRNGAAGSGEATFGAMADRIYQQAFGAASGNRIGSGGDRSVPRITNADEEDGDSEKEGEKKEMNADEMRRARLARFGGAGASTSTDTAAEPSTAESASTSTDPANLAPTSNTESRPRPRTPPAPAPARPSPTPPPPAPPLTLPKGLHRSKNLVCPQCRTSCSERAPHRIFVLSELLSLIRTAEESGMLQSSSTPAPHETEPEAVRTDLPGLDEADTTWGGLFPGVGGTESNKDRRRRLAQIVRDNDDGVRRCGDCNWEINERSGICEGCGRSWNMSDNEDQSDDSSVDVVPDARRVLAGLQRRLGRNHHALEDSDRSDDGEPIEENEDEYESDDFLVRSGEEDGAGAGEEVIWSDDGDSEVERKEIRRAARRRRQRRQEGEVIDLESETEDEEDSGSNSQGSNSQGSDSDDSDGSGNSDAAPTRRRRVELALDSSSSSSHSGSEDSEDEARPPIPFVARATADSESSSSSDDSEEEAPPPRRKKRVIEEESESD